MAVFRVEKKGDFTIMSNNHLRNMRLSLKAKGLLSVMLSLPETWDYTLKGLASINKEGIDAIRVAVNELENEGYIERRRLRNAKGRFGDIEYIIHEKPIERRSEETEKSASSAPDPQSPVFVSPTSENPISDISMQETTTQENPTQLNTNKSNTKELKTDCIKNPSINNAQQNFSSHSGRAYEAQEGWIDRYNKASEQIKDSIEYESLCQLHDRGIVDNCVNIMAEVLTVDTEYYSIEGSRYPAELVKHRISNVTYEMLDTFLLHFEMRTEKIHNIKAYLLTSIFNTVTTASAQMHNRVNHDMYGNRERE